MLQGPKHLCLWLSLFTAFLLLFQADLSRGEPLETPAGPGEPSLERMLGAMIMVGFRGLHLSDDNPFLHGIDRGIPGHVVLFDRDMPSRGAFDRNLKNRRQITELTRTLRDRAPCPMLVAVDQEGGKIQRLRTRQGFTEIPSAQEMGEGQPKETMHYGSSIAKELHAVGINVDFAPVVDVNANPQNPIITFYKRSFAADPDAVATHAEAFCRGLTLHHVIPCLKHFPGHGCSREDSHQGVTDITRCFDAQRDLAPYRKLIAKGYSGMIMPGHLMVRNLDPRYPASLSRIILHDILRKELGWQGVIISDDLQMKAISGQYSLEETVRLAVLAGNDILLFGNQIDYDPQIAGKVHAILLKLVNEGTIPIPRIRESWQRISRLCALYGIR